MHVKERRAVIQKYEMVKEGNHHVIQTCDPSEIEMKRHDDFRFSASQLGSALHAPHMNDKEQCSMAGFLNRMYELQMRLAA